MRQELMTCSSILFNPVQPNWKLFWGWWDNWKVKKSSKTLRLLYNFRGLLPWKRLSQQSNILDLKKVTGLDTSHQWICHSKIWYSPNIFQSLTHLSLYEHTQYSMFRKIYPTKDIICSKKKRRKQFSKSEAQETNDVQGHILTIGDYCLKNNVTYHTIHSYRWLALIFSINKTNKGKNKMIPIIWTVLNETSVS